LPFALQITLKTNGISNGHGYTLNIIVIITSHNNNNHYCPIYNYDEKIIMTNNTERLSPHQ